MTQKNMIYTDNYKYLLQIKKSYLIINNRRYQRSIFGLNLKF